MPTFEQNAVYLQSGNPETEDVATLAEPGTLGARFTVMNPVSRAAGAPAPRAKRYQLVKTDPAMAVAPVQGGVAYWFDKGGYVVTSNPAVLNAIAGRFAFGITKGNYGCIQIGGPGVTKIVAADMATIAAGDSVIGGTVNAGTKVASGTASTNVPLGRVASPIVKDAPNNTVVVDIDVPETV